MELAKAIAAIEAAKARWDKTLAGHSASDNYPAWKQARDYGHSMLLSSLTAAGVSVREDFQGATINFAGIRSGSTGGLHGAVTNWLGRAKLELAKQAREAGHAN